MILSEQTRDGRRFRIVVQEWYGVEWGSANARDEAVRQMVRDTAVQMMLVVGEATIREVLNQQAESGQKGGE